MLSVPHLAQLLSFKTVRPCPPSGTLLDLWDGENLKNAREQGIILDDDFVCLNNWDGYCLNGETSTWVWSHRILDVPPEVSLLSSELYSLTCSSDMKHFLTSLHCLSQALRNPNPLIPTNLSLKLKQKY